MIRLGLYLIAGGLAAIGLILIISAVAAASRYGALGSVLGLVPAYWGFGMMVSALFIAGFARIIELLEKIHFALEPAAIGSPISRQEPDLMPIQPKTRSGSRQGAKVKSAGACFWRIRSFEGALLKAVPLSAGGAELMSWQNGSWQPSAVSFDKFVQSDLASAEELHAAGIQV
jgi:hypothetical protein